MGATWAVRRVLREVWAATAKKSAKKKRTKRAAVAVVPAVTESTLPLKPVKNGQVYIKTEVLRQLSGITDGMILKAKRGGTGPLKLLWELGKLHEDPTSKRTQKAQSLANFLMKDLRKKAAVKRRQLRLPSAKQKRESRSETNEESAFGKVENKWTKDDGMGGDAGGATPCGALDGGDRADFDDDDPGHGLQR